MSEKITTLTQMEMAAVRGLQAAGEVAQAAADAIEEVLDAVKADKAEAFTYLEDQTDPDALQSPGLYSIGANKYLVLRHNDERFTLFQIRITTSNTEPIAFAYRHNDTGSSGYWSEWESLGGVPDSSITAEKLTDAFLSSLYRYYGYSSGNYSPDQIHEVGVHGGAYTGPTGWPSSYSSQAMPLILEAEVGHGIYSGSPDWDNMKTKMQVCIGPDGTLSCRYKIPQSTGTPDDWQWSAWSSKGVDVVNTLTSTSTTQALSAAQGKALNDKAVKYGTCSTAASTAAKTATISGFSLVSGALVVVRFTSGNTASSPTLNISGTGAKRIYRDGSSSDSLDLASGEAVLLVYDGSYYRVVDIPDASTTRAGKVQLNNTLTSTSTTQALTAAQGKALNDKIPDIEVKSGSCTLRTNTGSRTSSCQYYKIGKLVTVYGKLPNYTGSSTSVSGLPFTPANAVSTITGAGTMYEYYILYAATTGNLFLRDAAGHTGYVEDGWKGQDFTLTYITDD